MSVELGSALKGLLDEYHNEKKPNERIIASRENEGNIARRCEEAA